MPNKPPHLDEFLDVELLSHPKVLFEPTITAKELSFHGYHLEDSVQDLDRQSITTTGLEIYPQQVERTFVRGAKVYVLVGGKEIEFTLEERIQAVVNTGGWLGYKDGARFRISAQKIDSFALVDTCLAPYVPWTKEQLIQQLGEGIIIKEEHDRDGYLTRTLLLNPKRQVLMTWEDYRNKLSDICLGSFVQEVS